MMRESRFDLKAGGSPAVLLHPREMWEAEGKGGGVGCCSHDEG